MTLTSIRRLILIGLLCVMGALIAARNPVFLTLGNIMTLFQEASQVGIVAVGFTFVMIAAGIDISIGAVIAVTSMLCVNFLSYTHISPLLFVPVALAVGCLIGMLNGFLITRFKLPDFIVTLATRSILSGAALVIAVKDTQGFVQNVFIQDDTYLWFGSQFGPIYKVTIAFIILSVLSQFFLKRTRAGTNIYATGANRSAAALTGINTDRTTVGVYAFSGFCAALAAVFISSRMMTAMPELGIGSEMDVIAAVVIGGTPFTGGVGDVWGTMIGAVFLATIKNGILKLGISPYVQPVIIGGIIVLTVVIDVWYRQFAERIAARTARRGHTAGPDRAGA